MAQPSSEYTRQAMVVFWFKLGLVIALSAGIMISIVHVGMNYTSLRTDSSYPVFTHVFVIILSACFTTLVLEIGMMVLLWKAIRQRSYNKTRLWVILAFLLFVVHVIVFLVEAFLMGWTVVFTLLALEIFLELISINIMYDFMGEIKVMGGPRVSSRRPPPLPATPQPTSLPRNVEIPMTTFKLNNLSVNDPRTYSNSNFNSVVADGHV